MNSCSFSRFVGALLLSAGLAQAQTTLDLPMTSQAAAVQQRIGVTDITIKYHRPMVNGRKIWGALVPYGKVWRAGANVNTTIEFSTPVSVEGKPLAAGIYGLHTIPNTDEWTIIFSKMAVAWGSYTYNEAEDALQVKVKPQENASMEEALEFAFENLKPESVDVTLKWEKLAVPFRVAVTDEETVIPHMRNELRGYAQYQWQALNEAAQFCLTKKINLEEGLKWAEQSIQNEERFENVTTKSELLKALNKPDEAKTTWNHALEMATAAQLYSYGRQLQGEKRDPESMEIFQAVAKRFPQDVYGYLAQARTKSAANDFAGAVEMLKKAIGVSTSEQQKAVLQGMVEKLNAKQDINK
ncbi:MAG: DUF2911 domain-containing protein [Chthoniobacterales bacterium]